MFISNAEKQYLLDQVKGLVKAVSLATTEITMLNARIKVLEEKLAKPVKVKKPLTAAQKAKQREYQRMYKARKKQELTQGTPNVSA